MNTLTRVAFNALVVGAVAGVSYIAGREEGFNLGKKQGEELSEQVGYLKCLNDLAKHVAKGDK